MREVRFEMLRPGEIQQEKEKCSVAYLPIGPLEWHGPHLPLGVDPLNAQAVAVRLAQKNGGVTLPTLYWGTERERSPEMLKNIGFNGDEWIVGMDFPANSMKSLYATEDAFAIAVREYLRLLATQDYKLIVIVNGHGATNHIYTLKRLAAEFTETTTSTVYYTMATFFDSSIQDLLGHATKTETSIMAHIHPESVDTSTLPPEGEKMRNIDYGIVDSEAFNGRANEDFTVIHDPRDFDAQTGCKLIEYSVEVISTKIQELLKGEMQRENHKNNWT